MHTSSLLLLPPALLDSCPHLHCSAAALLCWTLNRNILQRGTRHFSTALSLPVQSQEIPSLLHSFQLTRQAVSPSVCHHPKNLSQVIPDPLIALQKALSPLTETFFPLALIPASERVQLGASGGRMRTQGTNKS